MHPIRKAPPPRVMMIEGRRTAIFERTPPLPPRLDTLLAGLRVYPLRITGWRPTCSDQDHRLVLFADGRYACPDGQTRDLRVFMCADCSAAQVRDVSLDRLQDYDPAGLGSARRPQVARLTRRDHVIGWYSGARKGNREYSGAMR